MLAPTVPELTVAEYVLLGRTPYLGYFGAEGRVRDYGAFYFWHRVYLYVASAQWVAGLVYVGLLLRAWGAKPQAA